VQVSAPFLAQGTPPRMRGTLYGIPQIDDALGNTPAYAGNTVIPFHRFPLPREHPRVCGEHLWAGVARHTYWGTPPRMRGTLPYSLIVLINVRNTPAYAGNTGLFYFAYLHL